MSSILANVSSESSVLLQKRCRAESFPGEQEVRSTRTFSTKMKKNRVRKRGQKGPMGHRSSGMRGAVEEDGAQAGCAQNCDLGLGAWKEEARKLGPISAPLSTKPPKMACGPSWARLWPHPGVPIDARTPLVPATWHSRHPK